LDEKPVSLLSEYISTFDNASVPAAVFASAVGNSAPGQTASAVKAFSAVAAGPFFNTRIRLVILPSIMAWACATSILYTDFFPSFAQGVFSSSFSTETFHIDCIQVLQNATLFGPRSFAADWSNPLQVRLKSGACLLWFNKNSKLYANEKTTGDSGITDT
jgi:hypothetical protein